MCSYLVKQLESLAPDDMIEVIDSLFKEATEGVMIEDARQDHRRGHDQHG